MHLLFLYLFLLCQPGAAGVSPQPIQPETETPEDEMSFQKQLYMELGLSDHIDLPLFEQAFAGYEKIGGKQKNVLTLIDFTKPSTEERLFVIDVENRKLLFVSHVAHGRNSGENYATSFSNRIGSGQSSLGFYLTENTYIGKNGYSLVLNGLEPGINDNAKSRAVVIHGAAYADPSVIGAQGRLGRSLGCPSLPRSLNQLVIDEIKNGSVLYIHAGDDAYLSQSAILNG